MIPRANLILLATSAALIGALTLVEALLFRLVISLPAPADWPAAVVSAALLLAPIAAGVATLAYGTWLAHRMGRDLETTLRAKLLTHLPLVQDSYFASRLTNDLAERGHSLALMHRLPQVLHAVIALSARIVFVLVGLCWLLPQHTLTILSMGLVALFAPVLLYPLVCERDMRVRSHTSAAGQIYLDTLRASETIAAHGAQGALQQEHESRLLSWHRALRSAGLAVLLCEVGQLVLLASCAAYLVLQVHAQTAALGVLLLTAYWCLFLPVLSRQLLLMLRELPVLRNSAARVFELLGAETELSPADLAVFARGTDALSATPAATTGEPDVHPVALSFRGVQVQRSQQVVLREVNVDIAAGEQIAIVGHSGSGKSSFLGLILGWLEQQQGEVLIDAEAGDALTLARLRQDCVVVDADLYLWNRSVFDNLVFGVDGYDGVDVDIAVAQSDLASDLPRFNSGLAQRVGENGARLSGGESQRVRVGRGLLRRDPRLVLPDEPFVGMNSMQRKRLLGNVLRRWPKTTLLFVAHDLQEIMGFSRVLVFDQGRVVADGVPSELAAKPGSTLQRMLQADETLQSRLWASERWRVLEPFG